MNAGQVIELIKTMEPVEIERLFVLIKEYEAEVRRRRSATRYASGENFEKIVDQIFTDNQELMRKLAEYEAKERAVKIVLCPLPN